MQIHELSKPNNIRSSRRVGRGGKRGTYSGRGVKGQKSRSGARIRPQIWDYIEKIPKLKGMTRKSNESAFGRGSKTIIPVAIVNVGDLNKVVKDGDTVNRKFLIDNGLVRKYKGKTPPVKLLGRGQLTKKIKLEGISVSESVSKMVDSGPEVVKKQTIEKKSKPSPKVKKVSKPKAKKEATPKKKASGDSKSK